MVKFVTDHATNKYYFEEFNKETGMTTKKVVKFGSKEFLEFLQHTQDPEQRNYVAGPQGFVSDDTPLGVTGSSKVFRVPRGRRSDSKSQTINYVFENGVPRFRGFKPIEVDGFTVDRKQTDDGDMLKIVLENNEISIADITVANHLRYLIRGVQEFNEQMLQELDDHEEELDEEDENAKNNEKKTDETKTAVNQEKNANKETHTAADYMKKKGVDTSFLKNNRFNH